MRPFRLLLPALAALLLSASSAVAQVVNITANVDTSRTWGPTGSPGWVGTTFWVKNSISIAAGKTLTIQPGVVVKFAAYASLTVGGAIRAVGTSGTGQQIFFTSIKDDNVGGDTNGDGNITVPNTSDWAGITYPATSMNGGSALTYCNISYAGYNGRGALLFQSVSDSVTNCTISKGYYGVDCQGTAAPTLTNTTIQASTMTPIVLDFTAAPVFSSLAFPGSDNGYDAIGLRGGNLDSVTTLPKRGATVGGNPMGNVTYVLMSSLNIRTGGSLTIAPGVVIKPVSTSVGISVSGNLTMNGTSAAGDTITITSVKDDNFGTPNDTNNNGSITAPARGDWDGITFLQGSSGSVSYCRLRFGTNYNSPSYAYGMIQMLNVSIPVSNTVLSDATHGLAIFGVSSPAVTNVQINNCSSTPVLESVSATATYSGIGFTGNAVTAIGLQGEQVAVNSHLKQRTLAGYTNITYYIMNGRVQMLTGATLTVDPGVVIKNKFNYGNSAQLSGLQIDGALVANGTALDPIVFTSERDDQYGNPADTNGDGASTTPAPSDWSCIRFTDTSNDATCLMNYCRLTYASSSTSSPDNTGGYPANVWITNASPTITNSLVFKGNYGIRIEGNSAPIIGADTFDNLSAAPIVMSVLSDPQIATNNTYTSNAYNALALLSETLSQDGLLKYRPNVGNPASPTFCYLPTGTITVASGVTLSIAPRVILKPTLPTSNNLPMVVVNGALNMVGADNGANRIFVTSCLDDALGGDATPTNATPPQAGNWSNIVFNDTAVDAACVVRNVKFQFGGGGAYPA